MPRDTDEDESPLDKIQEGLDRLLGGPITRIILTYDRKPGQSFSMPGVPRVGDIIDVLPGEHVPPGDPRVKYVEVWRVVWELPSATDKPSDPSSEDLGAVTVYAKSARN